MPALNSVQRIQDLKTDKQGGSRRGAGRKADCFRKRCAELAMSPKFFAFAEKVFNSERTEPRLTKEGTVVYLEASVGDTVHSCAVAGRR